MVHHFVYSTLVFYIRGPLVKWPKTPASHAGNTSSNLVRVTKKSVKQHCCLIYIVPKGAHIVGVDCGEGPPVPIPNTEVKLVCAEDTWREAARENK